MKKIGLGLLVTLFILMGCGKGKTTFDDLKSIDPGSTTSKVVEYVGEPKEKTINKEEIYDWAPDYLLDNKENFPKLEMYVYTLEDGKEAHFFFSDDKLIYKKPLGLNDISE